MKKFVLLFAALMALVPFVARAQDEDLVDDRNDAIAQKSRLMDMDQRWSDLQFHKEMQKIELEKARAQIGPNQCGPMPFPRHHRPVRCMMMAMWVVFCAIVNLLLAIWVYQDIRKRNSGSGIWIVVVLMTGFFGGLLYALVRLGDIRAGGTSA